MSPVSDLISQSAARSCAVHRKIAGAIYRTPVIASRLPMAEGTRLFYKTENFQHTGSFKLRGASAKLTTVPLDRPVITASSGNHGIACSLAAQTTGHELIVVLPETVVAKKRKTIEGFGTKVVIHGADASLSELHAQQLAEAEGYTYISPYNDAEVIAGQGTAALELLDQIEGADNVFISMGGGGLISGMGSVIKEFSPQTRVIGVSATNSCALAASIKAGKIVETEHLDTLADGVAGGVDADSLTLPMASEVIDEIVHCDEGQIAAALKVLAWEENMLVEGAAALALAAYLADPEKYAGQTSVILLCGGNYEVEQLRGVI
ncbi:pyridoxal-phosphate dependent enzyme (plasmid) [Sulfitobacter sp. W027]|uniref:pyridoxal-phosphate dependent enzyme n=1 Tax=Sulfitobacter sp. W027 TaxID=2867025 RepID=UPI0021A3A5FD|nr:pyridoxal-phosphate dependent enzyme [Sulfitobacter sp. W027]UWR35415.1 pyridoxal-phosphate dependent enzyme [Sulfitobacter sp. W027]